MVGTVFLAYILLEVQTLRKARGCSSRLRSPTSRRCMNPVTTMPTENTTRMLLLPIMLLWKRSVEDMRVCTAVQLNQEFRDTI